MTPIHPATLRALLRDRRPSQGFVMPLALIAALAVIAAVLLETSRSSNSLSGSIRTAEARKALEAAEFGVQALLDALNTNQNSYLLVTRFTNGSGTGTWQTVSAANLSACGIQVPTPAPAANRLAGVSSNSTGPTMAVPNEPGVTFSLVNFDPPSGAAAAASGCDMFGNLAGGRARMTVRGIVTRGGIEKARFDLVRSFTVAAVNQPKTNVAGLLITGPPDKSKLGSPFFVLFDDNDDAEIAWSGSVPVDPGGNVNCVGCSASSDLDSGGTLFGSQFNGPVPGLPTFPSIPAELAAVAAKDIGSSYTIYPYTTAATGPGSPLESECRFLTVNGVANAEIGCRLGDVSISGSNQIIVRADVRPVNWYVSGKFVVSGSGQFTISDGNSGTPPATDLSQYWRNLRIYGNPGTPAANASNCDQELTLSGGGTATGAFVWFPLGKAKISGGSTGNPAPDFYGALWTCIFNQGSGNSTILFPQDVTQTVAPGVSGSFLYRAYGGS